MSSTPDFGVEPSAFGAQKCDIRVLCLGNDLLRDDSLGSMVAAHVRQFAPANVEVLSTPETGFQLLDYALNVGRLIVVDTVVTGSAPPGTIYEIRDVDLKSLTGVSPHYVGLFEVLAVSRHVGLPAAEEVIILAVEAEDCFCIGKDMHPAVLAAVPGLIKMVRNRIAAGIGSVGRREKGTTRPSQSS